MTGNTTVTLRVRIFTPDVQPLFCVLSFEADPARKVVVADTAAGRSEDFRTLSLDCSSSEMRAWFEQVRYYGRTDARITADLQSHAKRLVADPSFVSGILRAVSERNISRIEYALTSPLEHILGSKHLSRECHFGESAAEQPAAPTEKAIPMHFMMAPLNGVPLLRLGLRQKVVARFADLKDPRTKAFIESLPEEERKATSADVVLLSLREAPDVGTEAVRAVVQLPGGVAAEVVEENRYIRVRLARSGEAAPQQGAPRTEAPISFSGFELPPWAIFGAAIFLMVLLATVVLSLI